MENGLHVIQDCQFAVEVWMHLVPPVLLNKFFSLELRKWIQWNISEESEVKFAVTCGGLWRWRNDVILSLTQRSLQQKLHHINLMIRKDN